MNGGTSALAIYNDSYAALEFYNGITSLSLWYSSPKASGSITVAPDLFGAGTPRSTIAYSANGTGCGGSSAVFSCWTELTIDFTGVAKSVVIAGAGNYQTYFANIQFEPAVSAPPSMVPEPSSWATMTVGFSAVGAIRRSKYRLSRVRAMVA